MASPSGVKAGHAYVLIEAIDKTGKVMSGIAANLGRFSRDITQIGFRLAALGVAASAPFVDAVKSAASFSDIMLTIKATLQATDGEVAQLEKTIKSLAAGGSFQLEEIANAAKELAKGGFNKDEIAAGLQATIDLARSGEITLAKSAEVIVDAINVFGLTAADASSVADKFFVGSAKGTVSVDSLAASFTYLANTAANSNMSLSETVAATTVLGKAMLKGTVGGTSMNQLLSHLAKNADDVKQVLGVDVKDEMGNWKEPLVILQDLSRAIKNMPEVSRIQVLTDLFDIRGTRAALALNTMIDDMVKLTDTLNNSEGAAREASATIDSGMGGSIRRLLNLLNMLKVQVGKAFAEPLSQLETKFTPIINGLREWVRQNQTVFVQLATGVAAITGLGVSLMSVGVVLQAASMALGGFGAAISLVAAGLGTAFAPVVAAIAGISAAFAAASAFIAANWDYLGPFIIHILQDILGNLMSWWQFMKERALYVMESFNALWEELIPYVQEAWSMMLDAVNDLIPLLTKVSKVMLYIGSVVLKKIVDLFGKLGPLIKVVAVAAITGLWLAFQMLEKMLNGILWLAEKVLGLKFEDAPMRDIKFEWPKAPPEEEIPEFGATTPKEKQRPMGPWSPPPTEEERQQRFDLAQKIQDKKMEIIEENKQLQLQMEREAEARRKAMSERVRDLRELYDLEAQLRTAQTAEERRDLIDQIRERRLGLAEQQREDALAEKEKALAHQEAVAKRQRDLREIDEMERRLGRRIDVRAPQTPGRRQTPAEQLPENSRLAGILGGLTAERERLLSLQKQSFTTQLPDALYAGTAEAMKYQFEQQRTMDNEQFKKMLAKKVESIDAAIFKIEKTIAERPFAVGAV